MEMKLEIKELGKDFGKKKAVCNVSVSLQAGVYGLIGENGAGKTTLMRMICGVEEPTTGEIVYNGKNIDEIGREYRGILGYLPQEFGYYPHYSAMQFMQQMAALKGINGREGKKRILELLEMVGLIEVKKQKVKTFSGGMIRRLGIAQALLNDPQIIIMDEPTAGLDPKERVRLRNLISTLSKDKIILLSTHIVSDIEYVADYILIMKSGLLLQAKTREETISGEQYKVWECEIPTEELEAAQERYVITNMRNTNIGMYLRIVGDKPDIPNAKRTETTLEDVYFYEEARGGVVECGD